MTHDFDGCRGHAGQKRLFDDTREAEKVVQWLTGLSPGDAAQLLLPCIFQVLLFERLLLCFESYNSFEGCSLASPGSHSRS